MSHDFTIYVQLLEEAVDCWRPVSAQLVRPGVYRIVTPQPDPELEVWDFRPGSSGLGVRWIAKNAASKAA